MHGFDLALECTSGACSNMFLSWIFSRGVIRFGLARVYLWRLKTHTHFEGTFWQKRDPFQKKIKKTSHFLIVVEWMGVVHLLIPYYTSTPQHLKLNMYSVFSITCTIKCFYVFHVFLFVCLFLLLLLFLFVCFFGFVFFFIFF